MAFRVGQKVVCVDDRPNTPGRGGMDGLCAGVVYTVREIGLVSWVDNKTPCIRVEELHRPDGDDPDTPYRAYRFRPVVSTSTGMAILEQIRRDVSNKELRPIWQDEQV